MSTAVLALVDESQVSKRRKRGGGEEAKTQDSRLKTRANPALGKRKRGVAWKRYHWSVAVRPLASGPMLVGLNKAAGKQG